MALRWKWKCPVFWRMLPWLFVIWGCVYSAVEIVDRIVDRFVEQPTAFGGVFLYGEGAALLGVVFFLIIYFGYEYARRRMRSGSGRQ